jgi:Skp family chaperone for outer membrane proteins
VLVLAALAASAVAIALALGASFGRSAEAFAAPRAVGDLGPADALLLNDAKPAKGADGKPLALRAEGGRLAWSDQPTARAWSIGAVHVDRVMKGLLSATRFAERRAELDKEATGQEADFQKRFEEMKQKYGEIQPSSPQFQEAQQAFNALMEEYQKWRDGSMKIREKQFSEQVEQAYRDLVNAVEVVSDRERLDIVMRFVPTANPFEVDLGLAARDQVVSRTLLKYPESIDITEAVMKELGVE